MGISQPTGMHYALTAPNFVCMQMTLAHRKRDMMRKKENYGHFVKI